MRCRERLAASVAPLLAVEEMTISLLAGLTPQAGRPRPGAPPVAPARPTADPAEPVLIPGVPPIARVDFFRVTQITAVPGPCHDEGRCRFANVWPARGAAGTVRRATIDDVARAAGVSRQTVSNVVRGRGRLGSATRDRVVAAIEELDYKPHAGAASLRSGRTYRIAYPIPVHEFLPGNVIMLEFLQFMVAAARAREHQVLVAEQLRDRPGRRSTSWSGPSPSTGSCWPS